MSDELITAVKSLPADAAELARFVLIGRDKLAAVRAAIRAIDKVGVAADVYKQKLHEAQEVAEAVLDAEVRLGELRKEVPKEKGGDRKSTSHRCEIDTPLKDFDERACLKKDDAVRFETMASHPDIVERTKVQARENGEIVTRKAVLAAIRDVKRQMERDERQNEIQRRIQNGGQSIDLNFPPCLYRVLYADPPWRYRDRQDIETLGGAEKHYPTMSLEDICGLPVPAQKDAVLFLWTTSPMLEDAFEVLRAWDFDYKSSFVWDKIRHNMGHYNSVRHEFLLVATRGSCPPDVKKLFDSVQSVERTEHSAKPEVFREIIDTLYPEGNRLEMFAREKHDGWDVWGNMV